MVVHMQCSLVLSWDVQFTMIVLFSILRLITIDFGCVLSFVPRSFTIAFFYFNRCFIISTLFFFVLWTKIHYYLFLIKMLLSSCTKQNSSAYFSQSAWTKLQSWGCLRHSPIFYKWPLPFTTSLVLIRMWKYVLRFWYMKGTFRPHFWGKAGVFALDSKNNEEKSNNLVSCGHGGFWEFLGIWLKVIRHVWHA